MIGRCLKSLALLALILAVAIGIVGKIAPHLFLRIPHFGFIPWAITGNRMPPNFDQSVWTDGTYQQFMQEGDVVLASGAKAGSVWLMNLIHVLRSQGEDDFDSIFDTMGLIETVRYPWQTFEERQRAEKEKLSKLPADMPARRIWWGHSGPGEPHKGLNPKLNPGVKYILIMRNGMEVTRSFHTFTNSFTDEFKNMFGGFPPKMSPKETLDLVTKDSPHLFFGYAASWWQYRHEPNVLLLHYANLRANTSAVLTDVADFLGIPLSDELREIVLHKISLQYMKTLQSRRSCCKFGYPGELEFCHTHEHLQSGTMDKGKGFFTEEMKQIWQQYEEKYFGETPDLRSWVAEGGPVP